MPTTIHTLRELCAINPATVSAATLKEIIDDAAVCLKSLELYGQAALDAMEHWLSTEGAEHTEATLHYRCAMIDLAKAVLGTNGKGGKA